MQAIGRVYDEATLLPMAMQKVGLACDEGTLPLGYVMNIRHKVY